MSSDDGTSALALLVLEPDLSLVQVARAFVRAHVAALGLDDDVRDAAVLLTSEAVTNAFTHGRSEARLQVVPLPGGMRIEVADDNSRHPQPQEEDADALDGRGLSIIDMLSTRWGVRDDPYGKTVWFEVGGT